MAAMRAPLWLKIGWTIWVIAWAPLYWKQHGLQNFLFFCDLRNLFLMLAPWLKNPVIFSWQATGLLLFQTRTNWPAIRAQRGSQRFRLQFLAQLLSHP
jgi:hypothetical protein